MQFIISNAKRTQDATFCYGYAFNINDSHTRTHTNQPSNQRRRRRRRRRRIFVLFFSEVNCFPYFRIFVFFTRASCSHVHMQCKSSAAHLAHHHFHYTKKWYVRNIEEIFETKFLSILHGKFVSNGEKKKRIRIATTKKKKNFKFYFDRVLLFVVFVSFFFFLRSSLLYSTLSSSITQEFIVRRVLLLCACCSHLLFIHMITKLRTICFSVRWSTKHKIKASQMQKSPKQKLKTVHASRL